jgi:hypothetical protein
MACKVVRHTLTRANTVPIYFAFLRGLGFNLRLSST